MQLPGAHFGVPSLRSEPRDELVQAQLLQGAADRVELARAPLDQRLALAHQLERLAQARLARVQAADDLLDARRCLS